MPRPALFLDRDGVINVEVEYLGDPARVALIPGAAAAIARINAAGVPVVVVTNQSGIARGRYGEAELSAVTARLAELLAAEGARIDASYYCPHHPDGVIAGARDLVRVPQAGDPLLTDAALDLDLDLARSVMVGDRLSDLGAARAARAAAVLVRTGYGRAAEAEAEVEGEAPDAVFDSLADAAPWLLARLGA